ncbi:MAG: phospholipase D-like domain-containing protein [Candidatus Bipolaricaulaceae bacterium]
MVRAALALGALVWAGTALGFPVTVLVTRPDQPNYRSAVVAAVRGARSWIRAALSDCRMYTDGATEPLLAALADAAKRGVDVQVLLERREDRPPAPEQSRAARFLEASGAEVRWDSPAVTLHAKFLVVDGRRCVLGSSHWTYSALERSVQVDLVVDSPALAKVVAAYFDLLWRGELAVVAALSDPPWPEPCALPLVDLPKARSHREVIPYLLRRAGRTVDLLIYRLGYYPQYPDSPSNLLLEQLIQAVRRGVRVRVYLEGGEDFPELAEANRRAATLLAVHGVQVRLDPVGATLHAKCLIVDARDVLVSSANWSYHSLANNLEAGVAFLGAPELARRLAESFSVLWARGRPVATPPAG